MKINWHRTRITRI